MLIEEFVGDNERPSHSPSWPAVADVAGTPCVWCLVMSVLLLLVLGCTRAEMGNPDEVFPWNGTYLAIPAKGQAYEKAFRFRVQEGLVSGHAGRLDDDGDFLSGDPIASGGCEGEELEIRLENGLGYYFNLTTASGDSAVASMVADEFDSAVVEYVIRRTES